MATVLPAQVIIVGAFKTEIVALFLVDHANHEARQFLVGSGAAYLLGCHDAALVFATVENDELLHFPVFREGDVACNEVMAVLFGLAFSEVFLPFLGVAFGEEVGHLLAKRVDVVGQKDGVDGLVVEKDIEQGDGGGHQLAIAGEDVATRGFQLPDAVFALLGQFDEFLAVAGLHHDDFHDDGDAEDEDE